MAGQHTDVKSFRVSTISEKGYPVGREPAMLASPTLHFPAKSRRLYAEPFPRPDYAVACVRKRDSLVHGGGELISVVVGDGGEGLQTNREDRLR